MAEERVQRRLAATLAADVVGYSRLMGSDEAAPSRGSLPWTTGTSPQHRVDQYYAASWPHFAPPLTPSHNATGCRPERRSPRPRAYRRRARRKFPERYLPDKF